MENPIFGLFMIMNMRFSNISQVFHYDLCVCVACLLADAIQPSKLLLDAFKKCTDDKRSRLLGEKNTPCFQQFNYYRKSTLYALVQLLAKAL